MYCGSFPETVSGSRSSILLAQPPTKTGEAGVSAATNLLSLLCLNLQYTNDDIFYVIPMYRVVKPIFKTTLSIELIE